jgi:hypothetical protein
MSAFGGKADIGRTEQPLVKLPLAPYVTTQASPVLAMYGRFDRAHCANTGAARRQRHTDCRHYRSAQRDVSNRRESDRAEA